MKLNSWARVLALSIASNHCVPREYIGASYLGKDEVCIGHRGREGDNGQDKVFAHIRVGEWDTMSDREGMNLHEFELGGGAELHKSNASSDNVVFRES